MLIVRSTPVFVAEIVAFARLTSPAWLVAVWLVLKVYAVSAAAVSYTLELEIAIASPVA